MAKAKSVAIGLKEFEALKDKYPVISLGKPHLRGDLGPGVWRAIFIGPPNFSEGKLTNYFISTETLP